MWVKIPKRMKLGVKKYWDLKWGDKKFFFFWGESYENKEWRQPK